MGDTFVFPASSTQRRFWFLQAQDPRDVAYNMPVAFRVRGAFSTETFDRAIGAVLDRHEALRTTFTFQDGEPVQVVHATPAPVALAIRSLEDVAPEVRESEAQRLIAADIHRPFDLAHGPLLRAMFVRLTPEDGILLITLHHIACDGWGLGVLVHELSEGYNAAVRDGFLTIPALPVQYADYTLWQQRIEDAHRDANLTYWRQHLGDAPATLDLATDFPRPVTPTGRGARYQFSLPAGVVESLRTIGASSGATLFMTLLAAFQILLSRYAGEDDVLIAVPVAGRTDPALEGLVGCFVNTVAIRADLSGEPTFRDFLARVRTGTLDAFAHQDLPYDALVEALHPERTAAWAPVCQVAFVLEQVATPVPVFEGLSMVPMPLWTDTAKFDLTMAVAPDQAGWTATIEYRTDLFTPSTIARLADHYGRLLDSIVNAPETVVSALAWLSPDERAELLVAWNATSALFPADRGLHELFRAQAERTPDAIALVCGDDALSYAALAAAADRCAAELRVRGAQRGDIIGVCLDRSANAIVSLLAVLEVGAAYVPLDPAWTPERMRWVVGDAGANLIVTSNGLVSADAVAGVPVPRASWAAGEDRGGDLAYLMYTSGTTGRPKAVSVVHRGVARLVVGNRDVAFSAADAVLHASPLTFDASTFEVWGALLNGARLVIVPERQPSLDALADVIVRHGITVAWFTADLFHQMVDRHVERLRSIGRVFAGGDVLSPRHSARFLETGSSVLINGYGPTENTTFTCAARMTDSADVGHSVSIGRPIANTTVYVLDRHLEPVPIGVPGELYTGGAGLARGYWNQPELTAERFVPHPFVDAPRERLYRTGDRVRYLADGRLEFLGRADRQVKIRGFRVELEEIEAVLAQIADVVESVVGVHDSDRGRALVAYVAMARPGVSADDLKRQVARVLPDYMVPATFVLMDALPRTSAGKVDHRALPSADLMPRRRSPAAAAPRTPAEEILTAIWTDLLHTTGVGIDDDFFELGGHSLLAMQLVARIRDAFGRDLPVRTIFEARTIAQIGSRFAAADSQRAAAPPRARVDRSGPVPLSYAQRQLWFLEQLEAGHSSYHVDLGWRLNGSVDVAAFGRALSELVERHEALRTVFPSSDGEPVQVVLPAARVPLSIVDLTDRAPDVREASLARLAREEGLRPFDLGHGPLLRATLATVDDTRHVLILVLHHIVCDGWSIGVLARELSELYAAIVEQRPSSLAPLTLRYADYAVWQSEQLADGAWDRDRDFWSARLADLPVLNLPGDRPRPATRTTRGGRVSMTLPSDRTHAVAAFARAHSVTLHMTLVAAYSLLLARHTGDTDVVIGSPVAGRSQAAVEGLIGYFVNTLALRISLAGDPTIAELLGRVRETALDAYAHGELPFEAMVEALQVPRDPSRTPVFQTMLALQSAALPVLSLPGVVVEALPTRDGTAKFDLLVVAREANGELQVAFEFNADLFDEDSIRRLSRRFATLLESLPANAHARASTVPMLPADEQRQLTSGWNATGDEYPRATPIHELLAREAARRPDDVALIHGDRQMTRRSLDEQATRVARRLRALGIGRDVVVGVCGPRSPELVVALVAILKAGGAYLPLSPRDPVDRQVFMLRDANARVLVAEPGVADAIRSRMPDLPVLPLGADDVASDAADSLEPVDSEALAYVMYTSGSTGEPKGVAVPHRAVVRLVHGLDRVSGPPRRRFLHMSPLAFDASTFELWVPLLRGGQCVLFDGDDVPTIDGLERAIARHGVECLWLTSALFNTIVDERPGALAGVQEIFVGGDALSPPHIARALDALPHVRLVNGYGPTEATTFTCCHPIERPFGLSAVPIGRPLGNTRVLILDSHGQIAPIGVTGELHIGGDGLARGYLNRPSLTAERFIEHPLAGPPDGRLFKSGDLARWRADGTIDFVGRTDRQVKVRGFRVELEDIEAVIGRQADVRQAIVDLRQHATGARVLEAVVALRTGASAGVVDLSAYLAARLPGYMVPTHIEIVDDLPLTANGKLDRSALARRRPVSSPSPPTTPRWSETERQLAAIWTETIGAGPANAEQNFFEAGGHSLLAVRMVARIESSFGVSLPVSALFHAPTIALLARTIEQAAVPRREVVVPLQPAGDRPPIVLVHAIGGEVWSYLPLARQLAPDWPCLGIQLPHFDAGDPFPSVETLATRYVDELRRISPGPCVLAGYSSGATIAFEMAQQLRAAGTDVTLLISLDGGLPNRGPGPGGLRPVAGAIMNVAHWVRFDLFETAPRRALDRARSKVVDGLRSLRRHRNGTRPPGFPPADSGEERDLLMNLGPESAAHLAAVRAYRPKTYAGRVLVVKARARPLTGPFEVDLGWTRMVSTPPSVVTSPGSHETMLREPYVRTVAELIRGALS